MAKQSPKKTGRTSRRSALSPKILLEITNELTTAANLDEALQRLVAILSSRFGAERSTVFLSDARSGELYARVAQGNLRREIRILSNRGIAGWCFTNDKSAIVHDAYSDERFEPDVDKRTGFKTKTCLCSPLRNLKGETIGVSQVLNKADGEFTEADLSQLEAVSQQAAIGLETHLVLEQIEVSRKQESEFLEVVSSISSEINLAPLLNKIISAITKMLDADRSTLFINDEKTNELYTLLGEGLGQTELRLPNHVGIVGHVFQTGECVNIAHAYADLRFNPSFDKQTGYFTRAILCLPVKNKEGRTLGVTQVLNKRGGPFTSEDEALLGAFTSQISIGVENAKLFDDVQNMKNYNESVLESMANAVLTTDQEGKIVTCNAAGMRILEVEESAVVGKTTEEFFAGSNRWVYEKIQSVGETGEEETTMDAELESSGGERLSVNLAVLPLIGVNEEKLGCMVMIEDISSEKRMKATMSRYMDPSVADQLMESESLGGANTVATVLASDVRDFTPLTEELGAQGIVALLNEYFTLMVDCIADEGGMLDKFIGDAILAVFGVPMPHDDDPDRAVRAAIAMMRELIKFNAKRAADGTRTIDHGIGINTDSVVSGNIGSPKRMDYTVIGDGVNLAARLESACKHYGTHVVVSEFTFKALKATYRTREIDRVVVKGQSEPAGVYEILDYHSPDSFPNMVEVLDCFRTGVGLYREGKWDPAIKTFGEALKLHPADKCSQMYVDRCEELKADPPEDWDGVWVMKSK